MKRKHMLDESSENENIMTQLARWIVVSVKICEKRKERKENERKKEESALFLYSYDNENDNVMLCFFVSSIMVSI